MCGQRCPHRPPPPGTFITEFTDGEKLCEAFLAGGEEGYHAVSKQLARIAQHYRFDGWLVNIENTLSVSRGRAGPPPRPLPCPHAAAVRGPRPPCAHLSLRSPARRRRWGTCPTSCGT